MVFLFIFLFGLALGSFLNAFIFRLEKGESVLKGRSYCPHCKHELAWYDLVPVVSFLILRGKCRYCGKQISWQYPFVELATAVLFVALLGEQNIHMFHLFTFGYLALIASLLIVVFVYDLKYYLIPDSVVYSAIGIALAYRIFGNLGFLGNALPSAFIVSSFFLAIFLVSKGRWMGFGDVKLAFFIGLFLGFPNVLVALFFAFSTGAALGIVLVAFGKRHMGSEVPFGPFLVAGTFSALFWGQGIVDWYLKFLLI